MPCVRALCASMVCTMKCVESAISLLSRLAERTERVNCVSISLTCCLAVSACSRAISNLAKPRVFALSNAKLSANTTKISPISDFACSSGIRSTAIGLWGKASAWPCKNKNKPMQRKLNSAQIMPARRPDTKVAATGTQAYHTMLVDKMPPLTYTIHVTMPNITALTA